MRIRAISAIFSIFALFGVASSASADPVHFTCTTEPLTTSFVATTTGEDVTLNVIHHNGALYMPIAREVVTPSDLPKLEDQAKELFALGDRFALHFKSSRCTVNAPNLIDCYGKLDEKINGHSITWFYFYTSQRTEKYASSLFADPVQNVWANVGITMDGKDYDLGMVYMPSGCVDTSGR